MKQPKKKAAAAKKSRPKAKTQPKSAPAPETERILAAIRRIPRGKVSTYGNVAQVAGLPRRARLVGTVLRQTPASVSVPWYRVINAGGKISLPTGSDSYAKQRRRLEAEGVTFRGDRVDLRRYGWPARDQELDELLWRPE